jgi:hypothetical protein
MVEDDAHRGLDTSDLPVAANDASKKATDAAHDIINGFAAFIDLRLAVPTGRRLQTVSLGRRDSKSFIAFRHCETT